MNACRARLCHGPLSLPRNESVRAVSVMASILCADPARGGKGSCRGGVRPPESGTTIHAAAYRERQTVQAESYDAIVVGSGISGGWAAKELTEKGLRVLLLERGKNVEPIKDYVNTTKAPWQYPHRGERTRAMELAYPVLKRDYPLNEKNLDWWASDQESPYTEVKRFDWFRGYHVGGRSLMWGRQSYRWSDFDFEANAREGIAVDWPIRYRDLAPWYDHVERHAGISGSSEGMPQLPDGQFQPPMALNCGEEMIAERLRRQFGGRRRIIPGRTANLTRPLPGRSPCQYRNACWLGCPFGGYFSTQSSTLPAAMATGRLTLKPFAIVTEVLYDRERKRATGVRVLDAVTEQTTDYSARVVFLCASTLNSTWLLLRSATDVWPGGLGSSSGELGHNLMDHHFRVGAQGRLEDSTTSINSGAHPRGSISPATGTCSATSATICAGLGTRGALVVRGGRARWPSWGWGARSRTPWRSRGRGASAPPHSARCSPITRTTSRSTRRGRTSGACRCSRSIALPARTSA